MKTMKNATRIVLAVIALLAVRDAGAQTSYPMLMSIKPVAVQVGQSSEHTVASRYTMYGAFEVLVTGEGVRGEVVPPDVKPGNDGKIPNLEKLKVRFTADAGALPGVRDIRVVTPNGVSTVGQLVVVRDPVVVEADKNDSPQTAQQVSLPVTLCGAIERNEDVDFYKFHVEAGTALTFHVRSQRLQDRIHDLQQHIDPIVTLRNAAGVTLAAADNEFYADPLLSYQFEHAGDYLLEIRDVRYQGNPYWEYCVEISDRPFVTNVFPIGIARGQEQKLQFVGFQLPGEAVAAVTLPMDIATGPRWEVIPMGPSLTNPIPIVVTESPSQLETAEPNNEPSTAQTIGVPAELNGRIEAEGDVDCYAFEAKAGEKFSFEVIARRQQSQLDSHLRILDSTGKQLALNDDLRRGNMTSSDSWLEDWAAPADGRYVIELRDLHLRGGPGYVYLLRVERSRPYFELLIDTDKTPLTPGTAGVIFVRALRKNGFQGEIQLAIDDLPHGVTANCGRILESGQDGLIVLEADHDAPLGASNVRITGTGTHKRSETESVTLTAVAQPLQETYQPGGGRGHWPVETHSISVGAPSDIRAVELSDYEIRLKPGESKTLQVAITRAEGFDKNVTLDVTYNHLSSVFGSSLPKGMSLEGKKSKTLLTGTNSQGEITLTAAANAEPVERQQIAVMANVSLNFVMKATYASRPVFVTIEK